MLLPACDIAFWRAGGAIACVNDVFESTLRFLVRAHARAIEPTAPHGQRPCQCNA